MAQKIGRSRGFVMMGAVSPLISLCCAVSLAAHAAPGARSARGQPTASLKLGSPKEDDLPSAPAATVLGTAGDALSLVTALSAAMEPTPSEIRAIAVEDLGMLDDPRALNALSNWVLDASPGVQRAALRAIGSIQHPRAEEILKGVVRRNTVSERMRMMAAELLLYQRTRSALAFLGSVKVSSWAPGSVKSVAQRVLEENPPGGTR